MNPANPAPATPLWRRCIDFCMKYLVPLAFTVVLVFYIFRKVDFHKMMEILRTGVDYWWILLAMGISVFSHIFRASRWQMQLSSLGIRPPFMMLCCSIFGTYALNLLFPRLGEVWRCTYVSRVRKASFSEVFGSMVADRLCDTLMVATLLLLTFIVASQALGAFLSKYPLGQGLVHAVENAWFWIGLGVAVVFCLLAFRMMRHTPLMARIREQAGKLWNGFAVIRKMPGKGRFLLLTLCIWSCYFLQLYVAFFAFPFTRQLCHEPGLCAGLTPCLVAFVLSSIGMAIPSNGGLGPWNIAVMFGLAVYGIAEAEGAAFSMLVWSAQTVMLIILGIYTMGYISLHRRKTDK